MLDGLQGALAAKPNLRIQLQLMLAEQGGSNGAYALESILNARSSLGSSHHAGSSSGTPTSSSPRGEPPVLSNGQPISTTRPTRLRPTREVSFRAEDALNGHPQQHGRQPEQSS